MSARLKDLPRDLREQITAAMRDHGRGLVDDAALALAEDPTLDEDGWKTCAGVLLELLEAAVAEGDLDGHQRRVEEIAPFAPPLGVRDLVHALHRLEGVVLDELALHERLGATSERWPIVTHSVRAATLEIIAAFAERDGARTALRDQLTTLMSRRGTDTGWR